MSNFNFNISNPKKPEKTVRTQIRSPKTISLRIVPLNETGKPADQIEQMLTDTASMTETATAAGSATTAAKIPVALAHTGAGRIHRFHSLSDTHKKRRRIADDSIIVID